LDKQPSTAEMALGHGLRRLRSRSIPEEVAQLLRDAIIAGQLKPGERLIEQKLAASLDIGQPTLREALKELEYQGFVRKSPKKGTYVTQLSKEDFRQILEVRMALEVLAIERAAGNMTETAAQELEERVKAMESAAQKFDLSAFHNSDIAFHRKVWALTGNPYLGIALERVAFGLFAFVLLQKQQNSSQEFLASAEQHKQILAGLRSRNSIQAREAFVRSTLKFWNEYHQVNFGEDAVPTLTER
jgi:DNA-binding GntR family transcriptional regulator